MAVAMMGVFGEVVLVILFGGVEVFEGLDPGDDLSLQPFLHLGGHFLGDLSLFFVLVEDGGTVLTAEIGSLAVEGGGVVDGVEDLQQVPVADLAIVVEYFDHFGVAGGVGADFFVGRVCNVAVGVAADHIHYPVDLPESRIETPETASAQDRFSYRHS